MWVTPCHEDSFFFLARYVFTLSHVGSPSLPSSYTDLAIRVQQVLEEALRESYAEEVDVDAESESDQTAAAPEIGGALSTAVAGSSSAHAADEPGEAVLRRLLKRRKTFAASQALLTKYRRRTLLGVL